MAKTFTRSNTNPIPGNTNPSGLNYAVQSATSRHTSLALKAEMTPPYILPSVWDYKKPYNVWRPLTPLPNRVSPPMIDFVLYHPEGMLPYYTGYIPNHKFKIGITFGRSTKEYGLLHYCKKSTTENHAQPTNN